MNCDKSFYRDEFNKFKTYIKLKPFCLELGIYNQNLSKFMKDSAYDDCMNLETLDKLYKSILNKLEYFVG